MPLCRRFCSSSTSRLLSDRFEQRLILVLGSLLKMAAAVLFPVAGSGFGFVVAGFAVTALALTLPSGVELSYVQSLSERFGQANDPDSLQRRMSGYMSMQALALLGAGLMGGLLVTVSFSLLYQLDALGGLLAAALALSLPTLRSHRAAAPHNTPWFASVPRLLATLGSAQPAFWRLAALIVPLWTFASVGSEYTQALLQRIGLSPMAISLAFAAAGGASWLGSLLSGRISSASRTRALRAWSGSTRSLRSAGPSPSRVALSPPPRASEASSRGDSPAVPQACWSTPRSWS
ncbi:MAG: hypothetical protein M0Z66_13025 [Thermaerobacter sp.]|nr:hypothetical protein [Thermaerobacter sp.]